MFITAVGMSLFSIPASFNFSYIDTQLLCFNFCINSFLSVIDNSSTLILSQSYVSTIALAK